MANGIDGKKGRAKNHTKFILTAKVKEQVMFGSFSILMRVHRSVRITPHKNPRRFLKE